MKIYLQSLLLDSAAVNFREGSGVLDAPQASKEASCERHELALAGHSVKNVLNPQISSPYWAGCSASSKGWRRNTQKLHSQATAASTHTLRRRSRRSVYWRPRSPLAAVCPRQALEKPSVALPAGFLSWLCFCIFGTSAHCAGGPAARRWLHAPGWYHSCLDP